jgi:hypothetical protein
MSPFPVPGRGLRGVAIDLLPFKLLLDGLPTSRKGIAGLSLEGIGVIVEQVAIELDFQVAVCSQAAVVGQADLLRQADVDRKGHWFS